MTVTEDTEAPCPSATFSATDLTQTDVGSNQSLRDDILATNRLTASAPISRDSCRAQDRYKRNALHNAVFSRSFRSLSNSTYRHLE